MFSSPPIRQPHKQDPHKQDVDQHMFPGVIRIDESIERIKKAPESGAGVPSSIDRFA